MINHWSDLKNIPTHSALAIREQWSSLRTREIWCTQILRLRLSMNRRCWLLQTSRQIPCLQFRSTATLTLSNVKDRQLVIRLTDSRTNAAAPCCQTSCRASVVSSASYPWSSDISMNFKFPLTLKIASKVLFASTQTHAETTEASFSFIFNQAGIAYCFFLSPPPVRTLSSLLPRRSPLSRSLRSPPPLCR